MILVAGAVLVVLGLALVLSDRFPALRIGRLPGDIEVRRGPVTFYFPLATSILLSVLLSLVFWLFGRSRS
jgi:Protein of unknown function (DUF2905)